jgi:RHS repeat-associated protein
VSGITLSSDVTWAFHRLFGDIDGNATVNTADYDVFAQDYDSAYYAPEYDPAFDIDGDHRDFNTDYSAFLADDGTTLTYTPTGAPFLTAPAVASPVIQDITSWTSVTNALYYSTQDQVLETRANGTVTSQSVWGLDYVNDLVAYDTNAASGSLGISGSGLGQRLYAQHDANYDVTALTDTTGTVVERYMYDPYGNVTVLNPDGTVRGDGTLASSHFGVPNLFQGMRYDSVTGLYSTLNRDLNPATGTWMEQDGGYCDGSDLYQVLSSDPVSAVDPLGTKARPAVQPADGAEDYSWQHSGRGTWASGANEVSYEWSLRDTSGLVAQHQQIGTAPPGLAAFVKVKKGAANTCDRFHWIQYSVVEKDGAVYAPNGQAWASIDRGDRHGDNLPYSDAPAVQAQLDQGHAAGWEAVALSLFNANGADSIFIDWPASGGLRNYMHKSILVLIGTHGNKDYAIGALTFEFVVGANGELVDYGGWRSTQAEFDVWKAALGAFPQYMANTYGGNAP